MQDVSTAEAAAPRLRLAAQRAVKTAAKAQAEAAEAGGYLASGHINGGHSVLVVLVQLKGSMQGKSTNRLIGFQMYMQGAGLRCNTCRETCLRVAPAVMCAAFEWHVTCWRTASVPVRIAPARSSGVLRQTVLV